MTDEPNVRDNVRHLICNPTIELLRIIGSPFGEAEVKRVGNSNFLQLYDLAIKNKISLLYLDSLKLSRELGPLALKYECEETWYQRYIKALAKVSKALATAGIAYVIFKTLKPYRSIPGDIDILILDDDMYETAILELLKAQYEPELMWYSKSKRHMHCNEFGKVARNLTKPTFGKRHISKYSVDFIDGENGVQIDLRREVAVSHIVYMDKDNFKHAIRKVKLPDMSTIFVPRPELELAVIIIHSLTEQLYLLAEYYSLIFYISKMNEQEISTFISIVNENRLKEATKAHVTIAAILSKVAFGNVPEKLASLYSELGFDRVEALNLMENCYKTPHRFSFLIGFRVFGEKLRERKFRKSVAIQLLRMFDLRLASQVVRELAERRTRAFYLKGIQSDYVKT